MDKRRYRILSGSLLFGNLQIFDQVNPQNGWTITDRKHLDRWCAEYKTTTADIDWIPFPEDEPVEA